MTASILDGRMPLAALLPRPTQRHSLVHGDVVADRRGLADDDAHAVVDEDALADPGSRMNLDPGDRPAQLGQQTGGKEETLAPQPVRDAVERDGMQSGRGQNRLDRRAGGRVTLPDGTNFPGEHLGGTFHWCGWHQVAAQSRRPERRRQSGAPVAPLETGAMAPAPGAPALGNPVAKWRAPHPLRRSSSASPRPWLGSFRSSPAHPTSPLSRPSRAHPPCLSLSPRPRRAVAALAGTLRPAVGDVPA